MKTSTLLPTVLIVAALSATAISSAHGQTKKPGPALLAKAKINYADAEKTALQAVPNATVKESELENEDGGLRWSFDLKMPGSKKVTEVGVDAQTGKIVENKVESAEDEADEEKGQEREPHRKKRD